MSGGGPPGPPLPPIPGAVSTVNVKCLDSDPETISRDPEEAPGALGLL